MEQKRIFVERTAAATLTSALGCLMITLAGCSMGWQLQAQPRSVVDDARSGRSLRFLMASRLLQPAQHGLSLTKEKRSKDLYISDFRTVVLLKNGTYKNAGTIDNGLVSPDGDFVDAAGNFYVADYDAVDIQEYKPRGKSPLFTYKRDMIDPVTVSVDRQGNVYEADYDGRYVNEYAQKSNMVMNSCSPGGGVEGVAVDARNDVFVDYNENASGPGKVAEYKGGLAGCQETVFKVALKFAGGMVLDARSNLIVVDQFSPAVDVIPPPYNRIKRTVGSNYIAPFHVTLDKRNKLAFVADLYVVDVIDYRSNSLVAMLGSANGFDFPASAADDPNALY
jgi:hypothetical protein